jgi:hypothetical protein
MMLRAMVGQLGPNLASSRRAFAAPPVKVKAPTGVTASPRDRGGLQSLGNKGKIEFEGGLGFHILR